MPPVKPLANDGTPATPSAAKPAPKPTPKPATPPKPAPKPTTPPKPVTAEIDSVKTGTNGGNTALDVSRIPSWLKTDSALPELPDANTGFVGFGSSRSGKWLEQQAAGIEEGMPYLFHKQSYIPLEALSFFLLIGEEFQTLMVGQRGKFHWASRDMEEPGPKIGTNEAQEHYVVLMLVEVNGNLIPIKGDFRGTKSRGLKGAIRAVQAAGNPEWLGMSDAHRITAAYPQPYGRVFHTMTTSYEVGQTSGNAYWPTSCVSQPATLSQMQMLVDAFNDDNFLEELEEAKRNYHARIQFLDKVIERGFIPAGGHPPASGK